MDGPCICELQFSLLLLAPIRLQAGFLIGCSYHQKTESCTADCRWEFHVQARIHSLQKAYVISLILLASKTVFASPVTP